MRRLTCKTIHCWFHISEIIWNFQCVRWEQRQELKLRSYSVFHFTRKCILDLCLHPKLIFYYDSFSFLVKYLYMKWFLKPTSKRSIYDVHFKCFWFCLRGVFITIIGYFRIRFSLIYLSVIKLQFKIITYCFSGTYPHNLIDLSIHISINLHTILAAILRVTY